MHGWRKLYLSNLLRKNKYNRKWKKRVNLKKQVNLKELLNLKQMENQNFSNSYMHGWRKLYLSNLLWKNKYSRTNKKLLILKVILNLK